MPKNRNKKRDESHNSGVKPVKKVAVSNNAPVDNLPVKNNAPEDNLPVKNNLPMNNSSANDSSVDNSSVKNSSVNNDLPVNNLPVSTLPASNFPVCSLPVDSLQLKHPLNSEWTLWYYLPDKNKDWGACQHRIHTVTTVEDFWSFFDHLSPPSELANGVDYSFFKNGIRPMWEAPQNVRGGRLTIINTSKSRHFDINEIWMDLLLFLVGEYHEYSEDICGIVLNVRNYGIKIAIWTSHQDKERLKTIGLNIRQSLSSPLNHPIPFEVHAETQKSAQTIGRASSKNVFTV